MHQSSNVSAIWHKEKEGSFADQSIIHGASSSNGWPSEIDQDQGLVSCMLQYVCTSCDCYRRGYLRNMAGWSAIVVSGKVGNVLKERAIESGKLGG
jgi:hypothetical protein